MTKTSHLNKYKIYFMQKKTKTIINAKRWIIPEVYPGIPENKAINNSLIITQQQSFLSLDLVNYKIYDP